MTTTPLLLDAPDPFFIHPDGYHLRLAVSQDEVAAAQRLRQKVFSGEYGARTPGPPDLDRDEFDDRCDHLIVWYRVGGEPPRAVATYRLLPPHSNDASPRGSGLAADREFGLMPLERLLDRTVEAGRACVHPDHRTGAVVSMLWSGVARYLHLTGYRFLLGCASMSVSDGGRNAAAFFDLAVAGIWRPLNGAAGRVALSRSVDFDGRRNRPSPRCCAATCGSALRSAGHPPMTRCSAPQTFSCCSTSAPSSRAICGGFWAAMAETCARNSCGRDCLADGLPARSVARAAGRLALALSVLGAATALVPLAMLLPGHRRQQRGTFLLQLLSRAMLRAIGVRVERRGFPRVRAESGGRQPRVLAGCAGADGAGADGSGGQIRGGRLATAGPARRAARHAVHPAGEPAGTAGHGRRS